jgi:7,8-dihydropterin-6-yl-methyl-4-(beta-D-ribofuranosyl)aminobenzene 5'-phosphate synthase
MKRVLVWSGLIVAVVVTALVGVFVGRTSIRFARERRAADEAWLQRQPNRIADIAAVKRLTILPLLDSLAADPALATQAGVSYLVRADDTTILFDVGGNQNDPDGLQLVSNAEKLGVDLGGVAFVTISHLHGDHVGNLRALLTSSPAAARLAATPIVLPARVRTVRPNYRFIESPVRLARGVASTGPIAKAYWGMGTVVEQSLAVNVEGKGIVLVAGCGHQSLDRMLDRAAALFDAPVYGVIGGLHLPATRFRGAPWHIGTLIRLASTGEQPWHGPLGKGDVRRAIAGLEAVHPGLVALSPHDSCDWTIGEFKRSFGERYREILVGREIVVE